MEKLIQFRLQADKLNQKEWKMFMHELTQSSNKNDILSWIFSYFYQSHLNQQNDSRLTSITNIVYNILHLRTKSKHSITIDKSNNPNITKKSSKNELITIDKLPSTMIQECASYLKCYDYLNFANCSRTMYVSCNTPSKLQMLNLSTIKDLSKCNLNQFSTLKGIYLSPLSFNEYIASHPKQNNLNNLKKLIIDNDSDNNYQDIQQFTNTKCIDFSNIKSLDCEYFGYDDDGLYDFDEFCKFLSNFPNLTELRLDSIFLTEYNDANENISKLLPKLQRLIVGYLNSDSVERLRNELINMHSHQMIHLHYDEENTQINTKLITKLDKLKELNVTAPEIDTLNHIVNLSTNLEAILINIQNQSVDNQIRNIIDSVFTNHINMKYFKFSIDFKQFDEMIKFTEMALLNRNKNQKKELILYYDIIVNENDEFEKREIELLISRIVNSLDCSQINSYIFKCSFAGYNDKLRNSSINDYIMKQFEHKYLVFNEKINFDKQIIICNKACKINGLRMDCFDYNYYDYL